MPKVTQEHLDARRAEILDGARRAFAEHGYEGATVARLEEATGLSRGAIFHYFENKTDLFVGLALRVAGGDPFDLDAILRLLDDAIAAPRKPRKVKRPRPVAKG